jgi:tetratricopeptide (TPR) repeat protein
VVTFNQASIYRDSETLWRHTLSGNPDSFLAHNSLGIIRQEQGKTARALEHFRASLRINPVNPRAHYNIGQLMMRAGRFDEAVHHFSEVVRLDPEDYEAHLLLANCLSSKGNAAASQEHYHEALRLKPDFALTWYNMGIALYHQGDKDKALEALMEYLERVPGSADGHERVALILAELNQPERAAAHFRQAAAWVEQNGQMQEAARLKMEAERLAGAPKKGAENP